MQHSVGSQQLTGRGVAVTMRRRRMLGQRRPAARWGEASWRAAGGAARTHKRKPVCVGCRREAVLPLECAGGDQLQAQGTSQAGLAVQPQPCRLRIAKVGQRRLEVDQPG